MAIQDRDFDLEELFLGDLQDLPFWGYFDDTATIEIVVIRTHQIVRLRNELFRMPQMTHETFGVPTMTSETFTVFPSDETFMDAQ